MWQEIQIIKLFVMPFSSASCSRSFWYSCLLGLLAPVTDGLSMYVQESLAIGRRGCTGRDVNEKTLAAMNGR
jgi:hypothetical protein